MFVRTDLTRPPTAAPPPSAPVAAAAGMTGTALAVLALAGLAAPLRAAFESAMGGSTSVDAVVALALLALGAILAAWYALTGLAVLAGSMARRSLGVARWGAPALRRFAAGTAIGAAAFGSVPAFATPNLPDDLSWGSISSASEGVENPAAAPAPSGHSSMEPPPSDPAVGPSTGESAPANLDAAVPTAGSQPTDLPSVTEPVPPPTIPAPPPTIPAPPIPAEAPALTAIPEGAPVAAEEAAAVPVEGSGVPGVVAVVPGGVAVVPGGAAVVPGVSLEAIDAASGNGITAPAQQLAPWVSAPSSLPAWVYPRPTVAPTDETAPTHEAAPTYEVARGDCLWAIAARDLGPAASSQEIAGRVADYVAANPHLSSNPDLIHPGEVLILPALEAAS